MKPTGAAILVSRGMKILQRPRQLILIVRRGKALGRKTHSVDVMATEQSLLGGNLGTVLETYGGKSLKRIVSVGAAIFGCGLTVATLIRMFWPDHLGPILCAFVFGLGIGLGYVSMNLDAALGKVEVCEGGLRLVRRAGMGWNLKRYVDYWSGVRVIELPWDRILKIKVGKFRDFRGPPPEHVVIRTTARKDIELPFHFWSAVGTERFATTVQRFVEDVKVDIDFILGFESGVWRSISAEPDASADGGRDLGSS